MATIDITNPTLVDFQSRMLADGSIDSKIIEILRQTNEILEDMVVLEANGYTEHTTTVRGGLPEGTWRKLNYGVPVQKSQTVQVKDSMGMLQNYGEVDKDLADLNGNSAAWRLSEEKAFVQGMSQNMARTIIYGDTTYDPERLMGLAPRYNSLSAANGENIIDAGGTGNTNTSIWLVVWGEDTAHGIYPKGSKAGLSWRDLGEKTLRDENGNMYQGYRTHYKWDLGFTQRDWRFTVRIANIDVTQLQKDPEVGGPDLPDLMVQALELLPWDGAGRPAFYCNRTIRGFLRRQIVHAKNVRMTMEQIAGKRVTMFDETVPVRKVNAILNTEARVV